MLAHNAAAAIDARVLPINRTRRKLEQEMDALGRKYYASHDKKILDQILELSRRLKQLEREVN